MLKLTFPDGSVREFDDSATGLTVAESISKSLAKAALAVTLVDWQVHGAAYAADMVAALASQQGAPTPAADE